MTETDYQPKIFWGKLVSGNRDLSNVGHPSLGKFNQAAYGFRLSAFRKALSGISFPGLQIFEGAFGESFYLRFWQGQGVSKVSGMDISEEAVKAAQKEFPSYQLQCGDLSQAGDFKNFNSCDVVTAIDVLYHITDDGLWRAAVKNLCGLVKKGGLFIFTEKFPKQKTPQNVPFAKRRPLSEWDALLTSEGFQRIRMIPVFVFMDDPIINGEHSWLGHLSMAQWRIGTKLVRIFEKWPVFRDAIGLLYAAILFVPEKILLFFLNRTPNLELAVYRRFV